MGAVGRWLLVQLLRLPKWVLLVVASTAVACLTSVIWRGCILMADADAFPAADPDEAISPSDIHCAHPTLGTSTCEKEWTAYSAAFSASDDPARVPELFSALFSPAGAPAGAVDGRSDVMQFLDTVTEQQSDPADGSYAACVQLAYRQAAYKASQDAELIGAFRSGFEVIAFAPGVDAMTKANLKVANELLAKKGPVAATARQTLFEWSAANLTGCLSAG